MEAPMKWRFPVLGLFAVLALCLFALPIFAQTTEVTTKPAVPQRYDITKEVTLKGTVSDVVKAPTREMKMVAGSHLIVETKTGKVDAALGQFAMKGKSSLSFTPGQPVEVTGIMKTVNDKQVFVTRLVQADGHVYKIRNERGFVLARVSRDGVTNSESKGGQL
jgi:DNA/RNA endonuclease YhcR with UshA esterase domain